MNTKGRQPFLVKLAIFTILTTIVWVSFDVYRAFTQKPKPSVSAEVLAPINPTFDTDLLNKLTNRVYFEEEQITSP